MSDIQGDLNGGEGDVLGSGGLSRHVGCNDPVREVQTARIVERVRSHFEAEGLVEGEGRCVVGVDPECDCGLAGCLERRDAGLHEDSSHGKVRDPRRIAGQAHSETRSWFLRPPEIYSRSVTESTIDSL